MHHRYTYDPAGSPPGTQRALLIDLSKHLDSGEVTDSEIVVNKATQQLQGKLHSLGGMSRGYGGYWVYFAARTRTPWAEHKVWSATSPPASADQAQGTGVGVALLYPTPPAGAGDAQTPLELQVALSLVSEEHAVASLAAELPDWDFAATRNKTVAAWDGLLTVARVTGGSEVERRTFYSALYRCFLMPTVHSETDGSYTGFDGKLHQASGFQYRLRLVALGHLPHGESAVLPARARSRAGHRKLSVRDGQSARLLSQVVAGGRGFRIDDWGAGRVRGRRCLP